MIVSRNLCLPALLLAASVAPALGQNSQDDPQGGLRRRFEAECSKLAHASSRGESTAAETLASARPLLRRSLQPWARGTYLSTLILLIHESHMAMGSTRAARAEVLPVAAEIERRLRLMLALGTPAQEPAIEQYGVALGAVHTALLEAAPTAAATAGQALRRVPLLLAVARRVRSPDIAAAACRITALDGLRLLRLGQRSASETRFRQYRRRELEMVRFLWTHGFVPWENPARSLIRHHCSPRLRLKPPRGLPAYPHKWIADGVGGMRRELLAMVAAEVSARRLVRAVEARWLLAEWEYYCVDGRQGSFDVAIYRAEEALQAARELPDSPERRMAIQRTGRMLGVIAAQDGESAIAAAALGVVLDARPARPTAQDILQRVHDLGAAASAHIRFGDLESGRSHLGESEDIVATTPGLSSAESHLLEGTFGVRGELFHLIGDPDRSRAEFARAAAQPPGGRTPYYEVALAELSRERFASLGDPRDRAAERRHLLRAVAARDGGDTWTLRHKWEARARLNELNGLTADALAAWESARSYAVGRQNRCDAARIDLAIGALLLRSHHPDSRPEARERFLRVVRISKSVLDRHLEWQAFFGLGRVCELEGETASALELYALAAEKCRLLREQSRLSADSTARLLPDSGLVYHRIVNLLVRLGRSREAFGWVQRYKAQSLNRMLDGRLPGRRSEVHRVSRLSGAVESLRGARIELGRRVARRVLASRWTASDRAAESSAHRKYRLALQGLRSHFDTLSPAPPSPPVSPDELIRLAGEHRLGLIEYMAGPDGLLTFILTGEGLHVARQPSLSPARVASLARAVYRSCSSPAAEPHSARSALRALYACLVLPVEGRLGAVESLVFCPDGPLHGMPFDAMVGRNNRYLCEDKWTSVAASSLVFNRQARLPPSAGRGTVLARSYGRPSPGWSWQSVFRATSQSLPAALFEARGVSRALGLRRVEEGAADRGAFFRALQESVAWYAGHVRYDPARPAESALLLAGPGGTVPLTAREVVRYAEARRSAADLIVLSGCESARGAIGVGEGRIGLSWALESTGARSVVTLGWRVNDRVTAELMTRFAENLARLPRADALRRARLELMRRYPHPYYWAAPVLSGRTDRLVAARLLGSS